MPSVLQMPMDVLRAIGESIRDLAELPASLQRTLQDTNALLDAARLEQLTAHAERISGQLEELGTVTGQLIKAASALTAAAENAQRQLARTTEDLDAANRRLEQVLRVTQPIDRVGKSVAEQFRRVTGRRRPRGAG